MTLLWRGSVKASEEILKEWYICSIGLLVFMLEMKSHVVQEVLELNIQS